MPRSRRRKAEAPIDFDEGLPITATPVEEDAPKGRHLTIVERPKAGQRHKQDVDFGDDPPEAREHISKGEGEPVGGEGGEDGEPEDDRTDQEKAVWSTKRVNGFPDSSFLHIKPGGKKDSEGKTVPRTLRMFPVRDETGKVDLPHVRNAIARAPQASVSDSVKTKVQAAARKLLEQAKEGDIQTTASKAKHPVSVKKPSHTPEERKRKRLEALGNKTTTKGEDVPEVLTWEAVRSNQMPTLGVSGLPESLEQDVPPEYRYWKCSSAADALLVREALVETRAFHEDTLHKVNGELRRVNLEWVQKLYLSSPADETREGLEPTVPEALPPVAKAALMLVESTNKTTLWPHEIVKAMGLDAVLEGVAKLKTDWVIAAEDTPEVRKAMGEGFKLPNYGDLIFATNADVEDDDEDLEWFEYSRADELIKHAFREGREIPIFKFSEGEERTILGIVMEPNEVDSQSDKASAEEIRQAAHKFMEDFGNLGQQHGEIVNGKLVLLETYIAPVAFDVEGQHVKKGSWLFLERVVDDELWAAVKKGEFTGFSIGGSAVRKPVP